MPQIRLNETNDAVTVGFWPATVVLFNQLKDCDENYDVNLSKVPAIDRNITGRKYRSVEIAGTVFIHQQPVLAIFGTVVAAKPRSRLREGTEN
jgi:hypothetical protein